MHRHSQNRRAADYSGLHLAHASRVSSDDLVDLEPDDDGPDQPTPAFAAPARIFDFLNYEVAA